MTNTKKQDRSMGDVNPVVAVVTGAVVGAGVAIAGAVALKNEKNRKKVKKVLTDVKDQAVSYMNDMREKAEDKVEKKLVEGKEKVNKIANTVKQVKKVTHTK